MTRISPSGLPRADLFIEDRLDMGIEGRGLVFLNRTIWIDVFDLPSCIEVSIVGLCRPWELGPGILTKKM